MELAPELVERKSTLVLGLDRAAGPHLGVRGLDDDRGQGGDDDGQDDHRDEHLHDADPVLLDRSGARASQRVCSRGRAASREAEKSRRAERRVVRGALVMLVMPLLRNGKRRPRSYFREHG